MCLTTDLLSALFYNYTLNDRFRFLNFTECKSNLPSQTLHPSTPGEIYIVALFVIPVTVRPIFVNKSFLIEIIFVNNEPKKKVFVCTTDYTL